MARVGVISVLEYRLGYSSMVNCRFIRGIVMNRHYQHKYIYGEYCGLARHGWTATYNLTEYGTYAYDQELFWVDRPRRRARIRDILEVSTLSGVRFVWVAGDLSCRIEDGIFQCQLVIEKCGNAAKINIPKTDSLFGTLSNVANALKLPPYEPITDPPLLGVMNG